MSASIEAPGPGLPTRWAPYMLSVLRIIAALLFIEHGTQKLLAFPVAEPTQPVTLFSQMGLAGVLEAFGGVLLLVGLFTRPVASILAAEMLFAYFKAHLPQGFWPILNRGELALLYCTVFLFLSAAGGGLWSLDYRRQRSR